MAMKKNVRVAAREAMQAYNYDPLQSLVQFAQAADTAPAIRMHIAEVLLPYVYPKLSNVTLDGEVTTTVNAESQANLLRRVLEDPQLADAAARLSLAAAEAALESDDSFKSGGGTIQ